MKDSRQSTILFVPGLRDHVEEHWQTILARKIPGSRTVPPLERDKLSRAVRVAALDQALAEIDGPVVLVAHSAGVMITAHWAKGHQGSTQRPIEAALLVTPADLESPLPAGYPTLDQLRDNGWLPIPRTPLPFPSVLAASLNDPLGDFARVAQLAMAWRSKLVNVGEVGHLNPAAGYGEWPQAEELLREMCGVEPLREFSRNRRTTDC